MHRFFQAQTKEIVSLIAILAILPLIAYVWHFLPYHILAEAFSVIIAVIIFWDSLKITNKDSNAFFVILGSSFLGVAILDSLHTVTYKGMDILPVNEINVATQFWISARFLESLAYIPAIWFANRKLSIWFSISLALGFVLMISYFILGTNLFPVAMLQSDGLTLFKRYMEYIIIGMLLFSLVSLAQLKDKFDFRIFLYFMLALSITSISEFLFTLYLDVYGHFNLAGHILKIVSFYFIWKAYRTFIQIERRNT